LNDLDKEELIKRVVSIEFNRFLEYYRNANDLNIDFSKKDHVRGGDEKYRSGAPRMFINLGSMDGFDTGKLLGYLIDITSLPKTAFGRIDIKGVYSFIDVEESKIQEALGAFKNEVYKGRRVRVDISTGRGGSSRKPERSDRPERTEKSDGGRWQNIMEKSDRWEGKKKSGYSSSSYSGKGDDRKKRKRTSKSY
jgi:ATP-dependent RNA helicase DeaD